MPLFGPPNVEKMKAKRDASGLFKYLISNPGEQGQPARQALIEIGPDAVIPMAREVQFYKGSVRPIADFVNVATAIGPAAIPALMKTIDLSIPAIYLSTLAIGVIGGSEAISSLERLAAASDNQHSFLIHCVATEFIKDPARMHKLLPILLSMQQVYLHVGCTLNSFWHGLKADTGITMLNTMLKDPKYVDMVELIAGTLGIGGDREATPALLSLLDHRNVTVQWIGAMALGLMGDPAAIEPLNKKLRQGNAAVRQAAQMALAAIQ